MKVRVSLADTEPGNPPLVLAWPVPDDPRLLSSSLARDVEAVVGGLPVILLARNANGDLHTLGTPAAERAAIGLDGDLDRVAWVTLAVPYPKTTPQAPDRDRRFPVLPRL